MDWSASPQLWASQQRMQTAGSERTDKIGQAFFPEILKWIPGDFKSNDLLLILRMFCKEWWTWDPAPAEPTGPRTRRRGSKSRRRGWRAGCRPGARRPSRSWGLWWAPLWFWPPPARDSKGISKLPLIQLILHYKVGCIRGSLEIPLLFLETALALPPLYFSIKPGLQPLML